MSEVKLNVVTISSSLEDSPEGMYRLDRLREAERQRRDTMTPAERALDDEINRLLDDAILYGG